MAAGSRTDQDSPAGQSGEQRRPLAVSSIFLHQEEEIDMKVVKIDETPKVPAVDPLFTGPVTMQFIVKGLSQQFLIQQVNFSKSVRNKFHTHNTDQILIVTEGKGIVATDNEKITVGPGDVIFFPAGEKHWHGAAEGHTFSHLYVVSPDTDMTQLED